MNSNTGTALVKWGYLGKKQQKLNALDWHPPLYSWLSRIPAALEGEHLSKFFMFLLHITTFLFCFNPLCCHCSNRPNHFIIVPFSFLLLTTCLQRRQSIAPPEGDLSAIIFLVQKKKTITVPLLYLASWQNEIDTYSGIITPLFINLVQKVLLMLPAHRHTVVGNTY